MKVLNRKPVKTKSPLRACLRRAAALLFILQSSAFLLSAQNLHLGDLDDDGVVTVRDLALLNDHISGTPSLLASPGPFDASHALLADMNKDGAINSADRDELIKEILQSRTPESLPLGTVRFTSPASGEGDVALTRETILHFTVPLSLTATLDTTQFYAEFAGQRPLSRVEISPDRKKATLFYQQPLPANSRLKITFDAPALTDLLGRPFDADGDGTSDGIYRMSFDTSTTAPIGITGVTGQILAAAPVGSATVPPGWVPVPVPGVTITVDGAEETLRTTNGPDHRFTLSPCPCPNGTFFVHIDGRTSPLSAWPAGDYYPPWGNNGKPSRAKPTTSSPAPSPITRPTPVPER